MLNRNIGVMLLAVMLMTVGACSHAPLARNFNEANSNSIAVQTVNPNAGRDEASLATLDGQKSERLLERYRSDTGKAPKEDLVTNVGQ